MFGVENRLVKIRNEQRAQKAVSKFSYSSIVKPETIPTKTWSGNVANQVNPTGVSARWVLTFTRTDGKDKVPMVDFPWNVVLGKGHYEDYLTAGIYTSVSGRDKHAYDIFSFTEGVYEIGSNYIKWRIDISGDRWYYQSSNGTTVNLTVQAISVVEGELTIERVI